MDLRMYVDDILHQLAVAAEPGGEEARALAQRLVAPLGAAIRLALQDVLAAAAEEITTELAPGAVELRLRGRNPEFVVTTPPVDTSVARTSEADYSPVPTRSLAAGGSVEADEGGMSRINLRMPEQLKARIEQTASSEGVSVNTWLLRAAAAALERGDRDRQQQPRISPSAQRFTGWAR